MEPGLLIGIMFLSFVIFPWVIGLLLDISSASDCCVHHSKALVEIWCQFLVQYGGGKGLGIKGIVCCLFFHLSGNAVMLQTPLMFGNEPRRRNPPPDPAWQFIVVSGVSRISPGRTEVRMRAGY
ncbi:hypothetical protein V8C26DRAFT_403308 [Trichoderma gracile]